MIAASFVPDQNLPAGRPGCCCCCRGSGICTVWNNGNRSSFCMIPCILFVLFLLTLIPGHLWAVWLLNLCLFIILIVVAYRHSNLPHQPLFDIYICCMVYGAICGLFGWIFAWFMAEANMVAVGPFLFTPSSFPFRPTATIELLSIGSSMVYGGFFPVIVLWMKCDAQWISRCCCRGCKTDNTVHRDPVDLEQENPKQERLLMQEEAERMDILDRCWIRLRMECVLTLCGMD